VAEPVHGSRQQIVAGAADMLRRRGLHATSVREVAKHGRTPLGSTYHYFPGGKQQLAAEAVTYAGETVAAALLAALDAGPAAGLSAFLAMWRDVVTGSDFRAGCPVLAVAIEEPPDEGSTVLEAAARAFASWESLLADSLRSHGVPDGEAARLATMIVASVEGATAMCRAHRSTAPLDRIAEELEKLVRDALPS
jgi:AcrR family transcriptional regulator